MADEKPRILHVDDDEANRYAVTRSLVRAGFDVTEAATGAEALERSSAKPDLIILDVRLPDIDGFEVCRRLKADPQTRSIPVLHLSASRITSEDKAIGLNGGAEGYLVRPVEPVELVATVNALLRARRSEAALQEKEQQFNALINGVRDYAIFAVNLDGTIASWHDGAARMTGYSRDEAVGMPFSILFTEAETAAGRAESELKVAAETGEAKVEGLRRRKDGTLFDASCVLSATRSVDGRLLGYLKLMHDVSMRKQADAVREAMLAREQAARLEAERVGQMKDEFLATLSHEIRTPLNAILGWSQIIKQSGGDAADVAQGLDVIDRNARAQAQIIDDLLDMSRIISGKVRLDMKPVDLPELVRAAVDSVAPSADAKGIHLGLSIETGEGLISGDASRLQQVYWNLLTNAIKFTPKGGKVSVSVKYIHSSLEVSVRDTGEGIDAKFLPHVFDRFRQADASTTRRHGGLGIGLSIVKQLVEIHGGTIRVSSDGLGHGATFTVSLPVAAVRDSTSPGIVCDSGKTQSASNASSVAPSLPSIHGIRALVVDDEADARMLLQRLLERCHASVTTAANVDAALALLETTAFDVLVTDIGMPGQDGYALIRRVRALPATGGNGNVPAIALTAYARNEDRKKAALAGFQAHITKPVEAAELIAQVARVTGRS